MVRFQLSERQADLRIQLNLITNMKEQEQDFLSEITSGLLYDAINRAKTLYFESRKYWDDMVIRDMNKDVSWEKSAKQYKDLYVELTPRN